jgi:O-antigen biosynthesis protein
MDHDDSLTSEAFGELLGASRAIPDGFYYSDFVNVRPNGTSEVFGRKYGWETYRTMIGGRAYRATSAFDPSARSMCEIFYAPNHVRAWSRKAYELSGGHDPDIFVGDDHDLVCRTYLSGVPFVHIKKPIYVYRRYEGNSFIEYNGLVQSQQKENKEKYLHRLVAEQARRSGKLLLDIGRESECPEGWTSFDVLALAGKRNIDLEPGSVGAIRAYDVMQRVPQVEIVPVMNSLYELLEPSGWLLTATPSVDDGNGGVGLGAFQDPSHKSYWSRNNFFYFT